MPKTWNLFTNFSKTYFKSAQIRQRKFESMTSAKKLNAEYRLITTWQHFTTTTRVICWEIGSVSSLGAFFSRTKTCAKREWLVTRERGIWESGNEAGEQTFCTMTSVALRDTWHRAALSQPMKECVQTKRGHVIRSGGCWSSEECV